MNLEIFDSRNRAVRTSRAGYRSMSINRKNKVISFSRLAASELGLTTESRLSMARDTDSKNDWYLCVDRRNVEGMQLHSRKNTGYCKGIETLYVCSGAISSRILDSVGAKKGVTFLISKKPVEIGGLQWYQVITSKPLRSN
jgi:hypothetical protein